MHCVQKEEDSRDSDPQPGNTPDKWCEQATKECDSFFTLNQQEMGISLQDSSVHNHYSFF